MIVDVTHPAWLRHRPTGSRTMRDALAQVSSRASLPVADPGALRPAGDFTPTFPSHERSHHRTPPAPQPLVDHAGARFVEMHAPRTGGGSRPVLVSELVAYLDGSLTLERSMAMLALDNAFIGTPVRELWGVASLAGKVEGARGSPVPADKLGVVERDGHAEAGSALKAFLDREILVSGDRVFQRFRPYLRTYELRGGIGNAEVAVDLSTAIATDGPIPFTPPRLAEAVAFGGHDSRRTRFVDGAEAPLALVPEGHDDGEDVRRVTRFLLGMAPHWLRSSERMQRKDGASAAETLAIAEDLRPWHMAARIGGLPDEHYTEAARCLTRALDHMFGTAPPGPVPDRIGLAQAHRYMTRVATPRYAAMADMPPADEAVIESLSP